MGDLLRTPGPTPFPASRQLSGRRVHHPPPRRTSGHAIAPAEVPQHLVERWFAELTNRKLRRSAHRGVTELETVIRKWTNEWNKDPKPFVWTKTGDEILETLAAYCARISSSGC